MTTAVEALVADYLGRLGRAAAVLPEDERSELLRDISEHLASAREAGAQDEASLRTVLDRLGPPEEIVAGAQVASGRSAPLHGQVPWPAGAWGQDVAPAVRPRGTGLELAAVLLLTVGSLVPVLGWLVGVGLLWASPRWRVREKLLGTLVVPLGPGLALLGGPFYAARTETCASAPVPVGPDAPLGSVADAAQTCTTSGGLDGATALVLGVLVLVAPVVVAVVLYRTAVRRAAAG